MDQLRDELRSARQLRVSVHPITIEHWGAIRVLIREVVAMRPEAFADNEVRNAVTVNIAEGGSVRFCEDFITGILSSGSFGDGVFHERNLAAAVTLLFEPGQAVAMCLQRSDHVRKSVAVDVVDTHF